MLDKIYDVWDNLTYHMPGIMAGLLIVLMILFGFGLGFLFLWFMAWVLMSVYNMLAIQFDWPIFSQWFWVGVWLVIGWTKKSHRIVCKKD